MLVAITTPSGSVSGTYPELSVRTRSKESRSVKRTGSSIVTPHSAVGNPKGIPVISATVAIPSAPGLGRMSALKKVMGISVKMSTPDLEDSMNTACVVIATFTPKPDRYDEVKRVLLEVSPEVHQEEGCELYALHEEVDGTLVLIEKWTTREPWRSARCMALPTPPTQNRSRPHMALVIREAKSSEVNHLVEASTILMQSL